MSHAKNTAPAAALFPCDAPDDELLEAFDELVAEAAKGNRRAIGAIAIAFGPTLYDEARDALGPDGKQDGGDVVQDFFLGLCEGKLVFPAIRGAGIPWMRRTIRAIAERHRRARRPPDEAAE
jgi:DNA-directed RNA polymerase specialized sigma24 family protein